MNCTFNFPKPVGKPYVTLRKADVYKRQPQNKSGQKFVKIVIGGKTFYYTPAAGEADFFSGKMYRCV